ncbi:MAG TPA: hypothetical protein PLV25_02475, partial [Opitutales bacterium]|nr:hypothetical protein [Opitutales bacterium]
IGAAGAVAHLVQQLEHERYITLESPDARVLYANKTCTIATKLHYDLMLIFKKMQLQGLQARKTHTEYTHQEAQLEYLWNTIAHLGAWMRLTHYVAKLPLLNNGLEFLHEPMKTLDQTNAWVGVATTAFQTGTQLLKGLSSTQLKRRALQIEQIYSAPSIDILNVQFAAIAAAIAHYQNQQDYYQDAGIEAVKALRRTLIAILSCMNLPVNPLASELRFKGSLVLASHVLWSILTGIDISDIFEQVNNVPEPQQQPTDALVTADFYQKAQYRVSGKIPCGVTLTPEDWNTLLQDEIRLDRIRQDIDAALKHLVYLWIYYPGPTKDFLLQWGLDPDEIRTLSESLVYPEDVAKRLKQLFTR